MEENKIKKANSKLLKYISYGHTAVFLYWTALIEHFPITKRAKVKLILNTHDRKIIMGIAVDHLKSIASIVDIPNTYIDIINQNQRAIRKDHTPKQKMWDLRRDTYLLLKTTYHKILQTGEE